MKTHVGYSEIKCVLVTEVGENIEMVKFNKGLIITNYHPILHKNDWRFPVDVKEPEHIFVDRYYNFVLEQGHSMLINEVYCITLGHEMEGPVIGHEYLGTKKVIDDLKKLEGWNDGKVILNRAMVKRDPRTSLIVGIVNQKQGIFA